MPCHRISSNPAKAAASNGIYSAIALKHSMARQGSPHAFCDWVVGRATHPGHLCHCRVQRDWKLRPRQCTQGNSPAKPTMGTDLWQWRGQGGQFQGPAARPAGRRWCRLEGVESMVAGAGAGAGAVRAEDLKLSRFRQRAGRPFAGGACVCRKPHHTVAGGGRQAKGEVGKPSIFKISLN